MFDKFLFLSVAVLMTPLLAVSAQAVTIDTVPVGNLGNTGDVQLAGTFGAVDYAYNIGTYEVTAGQYTEFLNAVAATDTYGLYNTNMWSSSLGCKIERSSSSGSYTYGVAADRADRPVNYVSFWDAARFANWLHNGQGSGDTESGAYINIDNQSTFARQPGAMWFIPTEDEWYKAAYHKNDGVTGNYFDYPTSSDSEPSNDLVEPTDPGNNATFYVPSDAGDYTIGSPYYMTEVGAHENSESPYDTFDQGGNLSEWNETTVISFLRGERGGDWNYYPIGLAASFRGSLYPWQEEYVVGFRVASVPEPGSITLLVCGLLSLICLRRRK